MYPSFNPGHIGLKLSLEDGMAMARRHGFAGFDFGAEQALDFARQNGAAGFGELLGRFGLKCGNWNLPFSPYGDEQVWRDGIEALKPMAELAQAVGALRTAMWILPGSDRLTFQENFDLHVARFAPIAELLAAHGVRIGLEFIGPETSRRNRTYEFIHDLGGMLELCRAVGPNAGLLLDSWHWYTSGGTVDDLAGLTNEQAVHVHINDAPAGVPREEQIDNRRKLPGTTGVIDITGFLRSLAAAGYDGPVTAEPFDEEVKALAPEQAAAKNAETVLAVLRDAAL